MASKPLLEVVYNKTGDVLLRLDDDGTVCSMIKDKKRELKVPKHLTAAMSEIVALHVKDPKSITVRHG